MITAMTAFLLLLTTLALIEVLAGLRLVRRDRPVSPPASHEDWSLGGLPSRPYAARP